MIAESNVEKRLKELGLTLPEPPPTFEFLRAVAVGDLVFVSGHVPYVNGEFRYRGKVGRDFDLATAREAAELALLGSLASLKSVIGDLDKVKRVVKLNGYVNCTPEFTDLPKVMDGASKLAIEIFGEQGRHARTTVGVASLPLGVAAEIEMTVQLK